MPYARVMPYTFPPLPPYVGFVLIPSTYASLHLRSVQLKDDKVCAVYRKAYEVLQARVAWWVLRKKKIINSLPPEAKRKAMLEESKKRKNDLAEKLCTMQHTGILGLVSSHAQT